MVGALEGLAVVEGSAFVAAPSGGMALAQLGADVIRFDQIGGGIDHQRWPIANGASIYWASLNKGKRSIAIDLRSDEGRALVLDLIEARGVFLSNFPNRGWMAYDRLRERRDDLIMVSISGSPDGTTAVDYTVNCAVGYPSATGSPDDDIPVNHVLPAWDVICGQMAALGVLAAERHRTRTGDGQLVSLALSDVAMATVANMGHVAEAELLRTQRERYGNHLYGAFGKDFVTSDGRRVMVVGISPRQWTSLLEATESVEAVAAIEATRGLDFSMEGQRFEARDEIAGVMAPWFEARPFDDVAAALDGHGVCWGPYRTFLEMVADDRRCGTENPMFERVEHPLIGTALTPGSPLRFGAGDVAVARAPVLGEHSEEILAGELGLTPARIGELFDSGTVA